MRTWKPEDVERFTSLFCGRQDAFGLMQKERIIAVRRPPTILHYRLHLEGKIRLGIYPLLPSGLTYFFAFDFDGPRAVPSASAVFNRARHFDLPLAWEISKSRGVHLWLFFPAAIPARDARLVARMLLEESGVQAELFPKQDALSEGSLGNFIWLPLSGESVRQGKTVFVDPDMLLPFPDQQLFLSGIRRYSPDRLEAIIELNGLREKAAGPLAKAHRKIFYGDLLPCAKRMLEGVEEGCRDMAAFRLAIHLKSRGYSIQEAEQLLQEWNSARNRPPLPSREVTMKIRSAYLRGYSGYGCEDPLVIPFCEESCPIKQKMLVAQLAAEGSSS